MQLQKCSAYQCSKNSSFEGTGQHWGQEEGRDDPSLLLLPANRSQSFEIIFPRSLASWQVSLEKYQRGINQKIESLPPLGLQHKLWKAKPKTGSRTKPCIFELSVTYFHPLFAPFPRVICRFNAPRYSHGFRTSCGTQVKVQAHPGRGTELGHWVIAALILSPLKAAQLSLFAPSGGLFLGCTKHKLPFLISWSSRSCCFINIIRSSTESSIFCHFSIP